MPARRPFARRLTGAVLDAVGDRAPGLSARAYRVVTAPLHLVDPEGAARAADARLDAVRDRVIGMSAGGHVRGVEWRRIERDLHRTGDDLQRIIPRLSPVRGRALTLRLAAYTELLTGPTAGSGSGRPTSSLRPTGTGSPGLTRDTVLLTGAAAGAGAGAFWPMAGAGGAVDGGLAAGFVAALGVTAFRRRRARKARIGALADSLAAVDRYCLGPTGVDLPGLDAERRALVRRARRSGRLDARGARTLGRIEALLDDLLVRLVEDDLEPDGSYLVQATVTRYLPDTLEPLLALRDPDTLVRGRSASQEVADHLDRIEQGLADLARRPARDRPETLLERQGDFLRSRFGDDPPP